MSNGFDGTEALTYHQSPQFDNITIDIVDCDGYPSLRVQGATEEALDCLAEVRNLRARISDRKIFEMHSGFGVKYLMTDEGPAVGFTGPPPDDVIDCIAEVRNVKEDDLNEKVADVGGI